MSPAAGYGKSKEAAVPAKGKREFKPKVTEDVLAKLELAAAKAEKIHRNDKIVYFCMRVLTMLGNEKHCIA